MTILVLTAMLLLQPGDEVENPWKAKAPALIARAEQGHDVAALRAGLDAAWRADDWQAGARLARAALADRVHDASLYGPVGRALWRAGRIEEAESLAAKILRSTKDPIALRLRIDICLARGEIAQAKTWATRLEALPPTTADDWLHLLAVRTADGHLAGAADTVRRIERALDPQNGYPEMFIGESIEGVAKFLDAAGPEPVNQVTQHGSAPLQPLVLLNLPSCEVRINGKGPYRMILDTGGSLVLSLDEAVAEELGLKSIAQASVRGVNGKQDTGQTLVDELRIGEITCRRVVTRTFGISASLLNSADGLIGTGLFGDARMTLDFAAGRLMVAPSGDTAARGRPLDIRIVADAKLIAPLTLQGEPAVGLLDTGADVTALTPSRLKQMFPGRPIQTFNPGIAIGIGAGKAPGITLNPGVDLVFGGRDYDNYGGPGLDVLDTLLAPIIGVQTDVLIGMPMFRDMKSFTVDYPRARAWVEWLK
jgi:hypothetical protein